MKVRGRTEGGEAGCDGRPPLDMRDVARPSTLRFRLCQVLGGGAQATAPQVEVSCCTGENTSLQKYPPPPPPPTRGIRVAQQERPSCSPRQLQR